MIKQLKSHLGNKKGFTLIELLIVIAIIAVLVLIVVVAIDPVQRLQDAGDRTGASNARAAGTLIGVCITEELALGNAVIDCDSSGEVNAYGNVPTGVSIDISATDSNNVCATSQGSAANWFRYQQATGEVEAAISGTLPGTALLRCP